MKLDEYVKLAIKTESTDFLTILPRISNIQFIRLDHASKGMITEVGEFVDELKKWEFYGKSYTTTSLVEELGDLMWYIAITCDTLNISLEEVMERNIAKLKARYGDKFNEEGALNRNLEQERNILENKGLAVMCEHANEVPNFCSCDKDCYCKTHTCKPRGHNTKSEFSVIHFSVSGVTTVCGKFTREVGYFTSNLQDTDCEMCIKGAKIHYDRK